MPQAPASPAQAKRVALNPRQLAFQDAVKAAYPAIFDEQQPKPLAVGIHRQLKDAIPDASMTLVRDFLRRWTRRSEYLQAVAEHSRRYDLNLEEGEEIDPDHRRQAQEALQQRSKSRHRPRPKKTPGKRPGGKKSTLRHPALRGQQAAATRHGPSTAPAGARKSAGKTPVIMVKKRRVVTPA